MNSISQNKSGFTLLEVLISIVILAFISIGISQAITQTYNLRRILSTEGDFYNSIRLSMTILQRDLTLIYSPIVMVPGPSPSPSAGQPQAQPYQQQPTDVGGDQTFEFWGPMVDSTGLRPSHFLGSENKISFISNSHLRVYKDAPESEFAKIAYDVVQDSIDPSSQMLVKTETTDAFNLNPDRKGTSQRAYALLHGIKKFKYRYYRKDKDTWVPSWDSDADETRNLYPDIVELQIDVAGPERLSFSGLFLFRPELPLRALNPSM